MEFTKKWKCMNCGKEFETGWIPRQFVHCPECGSNNIFRIDAGRGRGGGPRWKRGACRGFKLM